MFKIQYSGEAGVDAGNKAILYDLYNPLIGGLKKEWFTLLAKEVFDPNRGLFKLSSNMRTIHPSPTSIIQLRAMDSFRFAGTLTGLVSVGGVYCYKYSRR